MSRFVHDRVLMRVPSGTDLRAVMREAFSTFMEPVVPDPPLAGAVEVSAREEES